MWQKRLGVWMRYSSRLDGKYHHGKPAECWVKGAESAPGTGCASVHEGKKERIPGRQFASLLETDILIIH